MLHCVRNDESVHGKPPVPGQIPHTDLEQSLRHCERSAAIHAPGIVIASKARQSMSPVSSLRAKRGNPGPRYRHCEQSAAIHAPVSSLRAKRGNPGLQDLLDCHVTTFLAMTGIGLSLRTKRGRFRHCERSAAIHEVRAPGLPRHYVPRNDEFGVNRGKGAAPARCRPRKASSQRFSCT